MMINQAASPEAIAAANDGRITRHPIFQTWGSYKRGISEQEHEENGRLAAELNRLESAERERLALEAAREFESAWGAAQDVFLRFGDLPEGGRSRNFATDTLELGVSVFRGKYNPLTGEAIITQADPRTFLALQATTRKLYIVEGDIIGTGGGGEPVLANARIVREITRT